MLNESDREDSFNENDFSIYSSKTIVSTFAANLHKIMSSNINKKENKEIEEPSKVDNSKPVILKSVAEPETSKAKQVASDPHSDDEVGSDEVETFDVSSRGSDEVETFDVSSSESIGSADSITHRTTRSSNRKQSAGVSSSQEKEPSPKKKKAYSSEVLNISLIDSDNEDDESEEIVNYEVSVKVIWKSVHVKKFQLRRFQKMSKIYEHFKNEENVSEDLIMLTLKGEKINPNDTPDSLNLQVYDFIDGGVLSSSNEVRTTSELNNIQLNASENSVKLKFQDSSKKVISLAMKKTDKMKVIMMKYAEQLECPLTQIKFFLDGELLEPNETPETLGLENDDVIDIKVVD